MRLGLSLALRRCLSLACRGRLRLLLLLRGMLEGGDGGLRGGCLLRREAREWRRRSRRGRGLGGDGGVHGRLSVEEGGRCLLSGLQGGCMGLRLHLLRLLRKCLLE